MLWQYILIAFVLLIISLVIIKLNKKNFNMEINKLVQYLGGKDNILDTEVNMSRLKVTLKDVSVVDKNAIEKLPFFQMFSSCSREIKGCRREIDGGYRKRAKCSREIDESAVKLIKSWKTSGTDNSFVMVFKQVFG